MARVVVTGGAGRLGRYVVRELAGSHDVVSADLRTGVGGCQRRVDVTDLTAVTGVLAGADLVVHLAALDYDTHARGDEFVRVNTLGSWNVLQACTAVGISRAIVCSSVAATGLHERRADWQPQRVPVDEDHENRPAEPYSVSKLIVETMAQSFVRSSGLDVMCLRPVAIVFEEEVDTFVRTVDGSAPSLYDYVTAGDVARAIGLGLRADWSGYECLLLSAADTAHPEPTLDWYRRLVGEPPTATNHAIFGAQPRASVFSSTRARTLLGWRATSDFTQIRSSLATTRADEEHRDALDA